MYNNHSIKITSKATSMGNAKIKNEWSSKLETFLLLTDLQIGHFLVSRRVFR